MSTLQVGSRGSAVESLQRRLTAAGYDAGGNDGIYGPKTRAAVESFQRAQGIDVDGIAGRDTFQKLRDRDGFQEPAVDNASGTPNLRRTGDFRELAAFARAHGFTVTSTNGGRHNTGSAHYRGIAADVRTRDHTAAQVEQFMREARAAGYMVLDERRRPAGQRVWGGPHVHLQIQ